MLVCIILQTINVIHFSSLHPLEAFVASGVLCIEIIIISSINNMPQKNPDMHECWLFDTCSLFGSFVFFRFFSWLCLLKSQLLYTICLVVKFGGGLNLPDLYLVDGSSVMSVTCDERVWSCLALGKTSAVAFAGLYR